MGLVRHKTAGGGAHVDTFARHNKTWLGQLSLPPCPCPPRVLPPAGPSWTQGTQLRQFSTAEMPSLPPARGKVEEAGVGEGDDRGGGGG